MISFADYHIHTERCGHASGKMNEYIDKAISLGLKEIGFADHIPIYWQKGQPDPTLAMPSGELPAYVAEVESLRVCYKDKINIRLGLEVDFMPGFENEARKIISEYPFEYVLGSVHYIEGWGFDNPAYIDRYKSLDLDELYRKYFKLLQQAAGSGLFTIMSHPDLIKKFGYLPSCSLEQLYCETAGAFAESGVYVEVNTSGLRVPVREIYPHLNFLKACQKQGVPFTMGSDAHSPEQVGYRFDKAYQLIKEAGYPGPAPVSF